MADTKKSSGSSVQDLPRTSEGFEASQMLKKSASQDAASQDSSEDKDKKKKRLKIKNTERVRFRVPGDPKEVVRVRVYSPDSAMLQVQNDPQPEPGTIASGWLMPTHNLAQDGVPINVEMVHMDGVRRVSTETIDIVDPVQQDLTIELGEAEPKPTATNVMA